MKLFGIPNNFLTSNGTGNPQNLRSINRPHC